MQVIRSYNGDFSLVTDLVRCSVAYDTLAELEMTSSARHEGDGDDPFWAPLRFDEWSARVQQRCAHVQASAANGGHHKDGKGDL